MELCVETSKNSSMFDKNKTTYFERHKCDSNARLIRDLRCCKSSNEFIEMIYTKIR